MRMFRHFLIVLLVGAAAPAWAESIAPVDEASRHEGLERVRNALREAFANRNAEAAQRYIHPLIENRVTGQQGREEFIAWLNAEPERWAEFHALLARGGRLVADDAFLAPYTATVDLSDGDAVTAGIVTGTEVRVRAGPGTESRAFDALSYERVTVPEWGIDFTGRRSPDGWVRVIKEDGEVGYIASQYVARLATYTLRFVEVRGVWWLRIVDTNFE